MRWEAWVLAAWIVLGLLLMIGQIGKPRKPIEPATCVVAMFITGALVWLTIRLGMPA